MRVTEQLLARDQYQSPTRTMKSALYRMRLQESDLQTQRILKSIRSRRQLRK